MPRPKVLITDYAWPNLDVEHAVLDVLGVEFVVAKTGEEDELLTLAPDVDAILTCWKPTTAAVLRVAERSKIVSRYGIGLDNIDVRTATELGMLVTNVPDFCLDEVADHTLALLLACARRICDFDRQTQHGEWNLQIGRSMERLRGQTLGLIGYGNTGRRVAERAMAFGLGVLVCTPRISKEHVEPPIRATRDLAQLLRESDYVSLHLPLTAETRYLLGTSELKQMQTSAFLINTSRGEIVDEASLIRALNEGWIAGAALDVIEEEPPRPETAILRLANTIVTPHAAFFSQAAIKDLSSKAAGRVASVLRGEVPEQVVNPDVLASPSCRLTV